MITKYFFIYLSLFIWLNLHIYSIASEYVPKNGDKVTFKIVNIPPKIKEPHAVEIKIDSITTEHKKWSDIHYKL